MHVHQCTPNIGVAYLDGISSGISEFRFILRHLNGSGFDWPFHCSAHKIQRIQENRFDSALMQRDLAATLAFCLILCLFGGAAAFPRGE